MVQLTCVLGILVLQASVAVFGKPKVYDQGTHLLICENAPIELGIVLDASSSIPLKDFKTGKRFLQDFLQQFDIGSDENVRVSLIPYGRGIYRQDGFNLTSYSTKGEVIAAVGRIRHKIGDYTDTGKAIEHMYKTQLADNVVRPTADRVSIVLTDGDSQDPDITKRAAEEARREGITMFAVGVGHKISQEELVNIAGESRRVSMVDNYDKLDQIKEKLARETCIRKEKPTTTPPPQAPTCGEVNPSDVYFVFSPASLGLDATAWTTSFISNTISTEDLEGGFRYGVISGSCPDDEGFDLDDYNSVDDIRQRLTEYDRSRLPGLLERLVNDGYTERRGARRRAQRIAVLMMSPGKDKGFNYSYYVQQLKQMDVRVFIADPTNSGVQIGYAGTLFGRSAVQQSEDLINRLCG